MRVLLTLGRLPVSVELARALHASGCRVFVADPLAAPLAGWSKAVQRCFQVPSPVADAAAFRSRMLEIIAREKIDLLVPVSEETPFVAALAAELPAGVRYAGMPQDATLELHDKWRFIQRARALELPVPDTVLAEPCQRLRSHSAAACECQACVLARGTAVVIKPRLSCSGQGVRYSPPGDLPVDVPGHLVQARLPGPELCCFAMAWQGRLTGLVTYRPLQRSASVAIRLQSVATPSGIRASMQRLVSGMNYTGLVGVDFMLDAQNRWCALECNPRATSGLHFLPASIIAASLMQPGGDCFEPPPGEIRQESWSCLSGAWAATGRWLLHRVRPAQRCRVSSPLALWQALPAGRDFIWQSRDPWPFLMMTWASRRALWAAMTSRVPMMQQVLADVGWYRSSSAPQISIEQRWPADLPAFLQALSFGSGGVRYRRARVAEQLARLNRPVMLVARVEGLLVGCYLLDARRWLIDGQPCAGWYRGALAVDARFQGAGIGTALVQTARRHMGARSRHASGPCSVGCIDRRNRRSLAVLRRQGAVQVGSLELHSRYRQWPRQSLELEAFDNDDPLVRAFLDECFDDCRLRDATPEPFAWVGWRQGGTLQLIARAVTNEVAIDSLSAVLTTSLRTMATLVPAAGRRFHPDRHRYVQLSHIAIRRGAEARWPEFLDSVMAGKSVHFAMLVCDPATHMGSRLKALAGLTRASETLAVLAFDLPHDDSTGHARSSGAVAHTEGPSAEEPGTTEPVGTQLAPVDF